MSYFISFNHVQLKNNSFFSVWLIKRTLLVAYEAAGNMVAKDEKGSHKPQPGKESRSVEVRNSE